MLRSGAVKSTKMSDINRCKTCRWWQREEDIPGSQSVFSHGKCTHLKVDYTSTEWIDADDSLTQWGMDAGYVDVATGPEFGCVHHESKE